jgi:hypothetical protein
MSEFDEAYEAGFETEEYEDSSDQAEASGQSEGDGEGPDPETIAGRRVLLQQLVDAAGADSDLATIAASSLLAMDEREEKAAREAAAQALAEQTTHESVVELVDRVERLHRDRDADQGELAQASQLLEQIKDALRTGVVAGREQFNAKFLGAMREAIEAPGADGTVLSPEDVDRQLRDYAVAESESDPLYESEAWQAVERAQWTREREVEAASAMLSEADVLADAQGYIDDMVARALSGE